MELLLKTHSLWLLFVLYFLTLSSCLPSRQDHEQIRRLVPSDATGGYGLATVHAEDRTASTGLTKRDIESLASSSNKRSISLQLASGEKLRMSLHKRSVDAATFTELTEEGKRETIKLARRDCYFSGPLEEEEGYASIAMCDGKLAGSVSTTKRDLEIHSLPEPLNKRSTGDITQVLVTWQDRMARSTDGMLDSTNDGIEISEDEEDFGDDGVEIPKDENSAPRRSVEDGQMTIEFSNYVDQHFLREIKEKRNLTTNEEIIDVILTKWAGVAGILADSERLGWNVTLKLVHVEIMRTNPSWYVTSSEDMLKNRLKSFCRGTKAEKYDQITLHTGTTIDRKNAGIAYVKGICRPALKCAVSRAISSSWGVEVHELGHNLGLNHDKGMTECSTDADTDPGFMGRRNSFIPECYKQRLAKTIPSLMDGCIFEDTFTDIVKDFSVNSGE